MSSSYDKSRSSEQKSFPRPADDVVRRKRRASAPKNSPFSSLDCRSRSPSRRPVLDGRHRRSRERCGSLQNPRFTSSDIFEVSRDDDSGFQDMASVRETRRLPTKKHGPCVANAVSFSANSVASSIDTKNTDPNANSCRPNGPPAGRTARTYCGYSRVSVIEHG